MSAARLARAAYRPVVRSGARGAGAPAAARVPAAFYFQQRWAGARQFSSDDAAQEDSPAQKALEAQIEKDIKFAHDLRAKEEAAEAAEQKRGVVQAPLRIFGLSGNYAHALFAACAATDTLEAADAQFRAFTELVNSDSVHDELFTNPALKQKDVVPLVEAMLAQSAGGNAKDVVPSLRSMFGKLFENRRLNIWRDISADFARLYKATKNEIDATLTLSGPTYVSDIEKIKRYVQDYVMTSSADHAAGVPAKVKLDVKIDPSIEGGFVVKFGDNIIDFSHKLARDAFEERVTEQINANFDGKMAKVTEQLNNM